MEFQKVTSRDIQDNIDNLIKRALSHYGEAEMITIDERDVRNIRTTEVLVIDVFSDGCARSTHNGEVTYRGYRSNDRAKGGLTDEPIWTSTMRGWQIDDAEPEHIAADAVAQIEKLG